MGAFDGGNDAFQPGQGKKRVDGVLVADHVIGHASQIVQKGMLRTGGGIIQPAGHGVDRRGAAVFILEHDAVEAVHHALAAVVEACGVIAQGRAASQRFNAVDIHRIVEEAGKHAHRVGTAAHTGHHGVGQLAGHLQELRAGLNPHHALEIAHHHGEGMRPHHRADAVDGVVVFPAVGVKCRVHRLLEGLQAVGHLDHARAQDLHAGHVGRLLFHVYGTHVDVAFQPEIGRRGGQRHAVLARAGFGDHLFLAHVLGQQRFAHAVVELMRAGVVEVLALGVELHVAQRGRQPLQMRHRRGPPLKLPADAPQLVDELAGFADGHVGVGDFVHGGLQLRRNIGAAVFAEIAVRIGIVAEIGVKIHVVKFHFENTSHLLNLAVRPLEQKLFIVPAGTPSSA